MAKRGALCTDPPTRPLRRVEYLFVLRLFDTVRPLWPLLVLFGPNS